MNNPNIDDFADLFQPVNPISDAFANPGRVQLLVMGEELTEVGETGVTEERNVVQ